MKNLKNLIFAGMLAGASLIPNQARAEDEVINGYDALGLIFQLGARSPNNNLNFNQRQGLDGLGALISKGGDRQHNLNAARAGKTDINVNVQPSGDYSQQANSQPIVRQEYVEQIRLPENVIIDRENGGTRPAQGYTWVNPNDRADLRVIEISKLSVNDALERLYNSGKSIVFACNLPRDVNGDKVIEFDEYFGVKREFEDNERITLVARSPSPKYGQINMEWKIFNSRGEIEAVKRNVAETNGGNIFNYPLKTGQLKQGEYVGTFSLNRVYFGKVKFNVKDKKQEVEEKE